MHHHTKFRADRSNHSADMTIFQFFKMAAVHHFGFLKVENLTSSPVWRPTMCRRAKFRADRSYRLGDMAVFQFFNYGSRPPYWICCHLFGPPTKSIWWSLSLCKIWLKLVQWFQ